MSATRSCPDWPTLLELAPDLHFKHYTIAEAQLPGEVLVALGDLSQDTEICADLDHNVVNGEHTDERIVAALKDTYWYDLPQWIAGGRRG